MGLELTDVATGEKIIAGITDYTFAPGNRFSALLLNTRAICKERHIRSMAGLPNKRHHRMDTHRSGLRVRTKHRNLPFRAKHRQYT